MKPSIFFKATPLLLFLLTYSCKEHDKLIRTPDEGLSIQSAKNIFNADNHSYTGEPDWKNAYYFNNKNNILKVPLESDKGTRELIFEKSNNGSVKKYVMFTFPNPDYLVKKLNSEMSSNISFSDYTGTTFKFKTNGEYIEGFYYENGQALNEYKINKSPQAKIAGDEVNCTNPQGPWIAYCASQGWLPGVTITPTGPVNPPLPPVTPGPPGTGGAGGAAYAGIFVMSSADQSKYRNLPSWLKVYSYISKIIVM